MKLGIFAALMLVSCAPDAQEDQTEIVSGPVMAHVSPPGPFVAGYQLDLAVTATDEDGIGSVNLYYKPEGTDTWSHFAVESESDAYIAIIEASHVVSGTMQYYFKGVDNSPYQATTTLPTTGESDPFVIDIMVASESLPWIEDFEEAASALSIYDIGWSEQTLGFPGYPWEISSNRSNSGDWSVGHQEGADGIDTLKDWLITPALDLSTEAEIEVSWYQWGQNCDLGEHALFISTGSPHPEDGEFTKVTDLENCSEDQEWERSEVVEISEWAGNRVAYLAWKYVGDYADDWYIDDVIVRQLSPDLQLISYSWTEVDPGGKAVVTVDLENRTTATAPGVVLSPSVDPDDGISLGDVAIGDIAGLSSASTDFAIEVDANFPDNTYLPVTLTATAGEDTWVWDLNLVVGELSLGSVAFTTDVLGYVDAIVGVGDPDNPTITLPVTTEIYDPGSYEFTFDLTEYHQQLPPGPGEERWWLLINSTTNGTLDTFSVGHDGTQYQANLGSFVGETPQIFYLPDPPSFSITAESTVPSTPEPGDSVDIQWLVTNKGAATTGTTFATLTTSDPDVTISSPDPIEVTTDWASGTSQFLDFSIVVSKQHVNSRPIELEVLFTDEAEVMTMEATIAVPWPVLEVISLVVDDHDNELLDPNENTDLEVTVINSGDIDTFGNVSCTMSQTGGSIKVDIDEPDGSFGYLSVGEADDDDDLEITVLGGKNGDTIAMNLDCTDGYANYQVPFELTLGVPPWAWISTDLDPVGDVVNDYVFDIAGGSYRSDGTILDIILESAEPHDPATAFIESWMISDGADYEYYQLVAQSGMGTFRGYDSGIFYTLSNPTVTSLDDTRLMVSIDLSNAGLMVNAFDAGFAAGFCMDTYYCDHFPDGWGDPYQTGMYTDIWFNLEW